MVGIHGFTFGSRYLFSTGGAIVTVRLSHLYELATFSNATRLRTPINKSDNRKV